jgi:hypothetical protein
MYYDCYQVLDEILLRRTKTNRADDIQVTLLPLFISPYLFIHIFLFSLSPYLFYTILILLFSFSQFLFYTFVIYVVVVLCDNSDSHSISIIISVIFVTSSHLELCGCVRSDWISGKKISIKRCTRR